MTDESHHDEFDQIVSRSLHHRAHSVRTEGPHFGDVRRRVRRRRQRQIAMMAAPAMAGAAYLATRPVAEPTAAGDEATTTQLANTLATTTTDPLMPTTTWLGDEMGYRCLAASGTDEGDGWIYYTVCEASPGPGLPSMFATTTSIVWDPTTTQYPTTTLSPTTTQYPGSSTSYPTFATTTTAP